MVRFDPDDGDYFCSVGEFQWLKTRAADNAIAFKSQSLREKRNTYLIGVYKI